MLDHQDRHATLAHCTDASVEWIDISAVMTAGRFIEQQPARLFAANARANSRRRCSHEGQVAASSSRLSQGRRIERASISARAATRSAEPATPRNSPAPRCSPEFLCNHTSLPDAQLQTRRMFWNGERGPCHAVCGGRSEMSAREHGAPGGKRKQAQMRLTMCSCRSRWARQAENLACATVRSTRRKRADPPKCL